MSDNARAGVTPNSVDLDAIRARLSGIAPAPWMVDSADGDELPPWILRDRRLFALAELVADAPTHAFIAHAREDVPTLLAEVDRLRSLLAQETNVGMTHETRSPDGDGQSLVDRTGQRTAAAAVDAQTSGNADHGTTRSTVQSDQQTATARLDAAGKPQTVSAGGRATEHEEPQLRRPRPQVAGSEPAESHLSLLASGPPPSSKCVECGAVLNEGEARTFTVCDSCWEKQYQGASGPPPSAGVTPKTETFLVSGVSTFSRASGDLTSIPPPVTLTQAQYPTRDSEQSAGVTPPQEYAPRIAQKRGTSSALSLIVTATVTGNRSGRFYREDRSPRRRRHMKTEFVQEMGEMHWSDGWHFKRLDDGSVRIRDFATNRIAIIPAAEWVSLIHHLGKERTAESFAAATEFHRG